MQAGRQSAGHPTSPANSRAEIRVRAETLEPTPDENCIDKKRVLVFSVLMIWNET